VEETTFSFAYINREAVNSLVHSSSNLTV